MAGSAKKEDETQAEMQSDEYEGQFDPEGNYDPDDPFAAAPRSINFTEEWEAGNRYGMKVLEKPKLIQGFDIKTKKPAVWDNGQPKMVAVTVVRYEGETRSLWAPKPSALFKKLQEATRTARTSMRPNFDSDDDDLFIEYLGVDKSKKKPGQNAPHDFGEVIYTPPSR